MGPAAEAATPGVTKVTKPVNGHPRASAVRLTALVRVGSTRPTTTGAVPERDIPPLPDTSAAADPPAGGRAGGTGPRGAMPAWVASGPAGHAVAVHELGGRGPPCLFLPANGFHARCYQALVRRWPLSGPRPGAAQPCVARRGHGPAWPLQPRGSTVWPCA